MRAFKVVVGGVVHHGSWFLHPDDTIEVRSDYGAIRLQRRDRDPGEVARTALTAIIESRRSGGNEFAGR